MVSLEVAHCVTKLKTVPVQQPTGCILEQKVEASTLSSTPKMSAKQ